ncbi:universal stress protein [uncultured Eudoraea sp.]|uniref:universal stress protein n=1 Tax=uncultured Eudoraea sp. TaxID=1035614 RepID=UPI00262047D9|nr:universal stress protein [uncultured Eudoraea sp.]
MKNILLPTDFSKTSLNAAKFAIEFFKEEECVFHLLNTYTPAIVHSRFMATTIHGGILEDNVRSESESGLDELLNQINTYYKYPKHSFKCVSSFNLLTDEIKEIVQSEKIDFIVTGTKGASGLEEVFLGSNTVRIIKAVRSCPILAVPEDFKYDKPVRIGLPTDFKRNFSAEVIKPLIQLTATFGATINIMHISEEEQLNKHQQSNKDILLEYFSSVSHKLHSMPYFASKSDVIEFFIKEFGIQLLTLVHYRHGFLEELVREPVVKRIAFHTPIPLLVLSD